MSDPQQPSSGGSAGTNLRSSPGFVPFAFDEPDNFGTFVSSPLNATVKQAALVRAKQLIEREMSYIIWCKNACIRNLNTTKFKTVMTTEEKLDKIIAILERMEARQIKVKEEVDDIQTHEPPIQGSWGSVNTGQTPAPR